ncbi:MAG: hypothetical protein IKC69_01280 [Clostridia bacterium]|nr:hypothetical protein [Clostridia bacterium]
MKRILAMLLCLLTLLSVAGCGAEKPAESVTEASDKVSSPVTEKAETEEEKTEEEGKVVYDKVSDPLTPERVARIPIANSSMTTEQLRQICVDYVKLSVSFQWVPNRTFECEANQGGGTVTKFPEGKLHGGLPYVNVASGNIYRVLEYYDTETGVLDMTVFVNKLRHFGTACSGTTGWGWARVVNSAEISFTPDMTQHHGFLKVGPYEYDASIERFGANGAPDCRDIAKTNGEQVMYQSYAASKMADCFVNDGHVRMNGKDPVVVYNADGTIDGDKSYIVQVEQGLYTTGAYHKRVSADGIEYVIQGNDGQYGDGSENYFTFKTLFNTGYLPHSFKELHGLDPVEKAEVTMEYTNAVFDAKADDLKGKLLRANYVISHVITTVTDANGNQKLRYMKTVHPHYHYTVDLSEAIPVAGLEPYRQSEGCTIRVEAFLGNGECLLAYEAPLA